MVFHWIYGLMNCTGACTTSQWLCTLLLDARLMSDLYRQATVWFVCKIEGQLLAFPVISHFLMAFLTVDFEIVRIVEIILKYCSPLYGRWWSLFIETLSTHFLWNMMLRRWAKRVPWFLPPCFDFIHSCANRNCRNGKTHPRTFFVGYWKNA